MDVYGSIMNEYEKSLKNMQQDLEKSKHEYEVTDVFLPKLPLGYQYLMDCRPQLLLFEDQTIHCGETKQLVTTCVISPNYGWILSTKCNPSLSLSSFKKKRLNPLSINSKYQFELQISQMKI